MGRFSHRRDAESLLNDHVEPKLWYVKTSDGSEHDIVAHFAFDNGGDGLMFRRYKEDNRTNKTEVVVSFAQGYWLMYKECSQ